ncbi:MAG: precorrin-3B C(17)-methyltransferase [Erysipelotrichales bacterium]
MLYVVGLGPGEHSQISPKASEAIKNSDVISGYTVYVDLIQDLVEGKKIITTPMKQEIERTTMAIEAAMEGNDVAMVCSGDAGVYGMAGLVYELADKMNADIDIEVIPGITAASSAAAVLGAPLIHDFAVISLSDLMTPLEDIMKRVDYASKSGFVIVLYNPSSKKRGTYLNQACQIIMENCGEELNCGYVRNIGRDEEYAEVLSIKELSQTSVDMFTTVVIGNKNTKIIKNKLVTPRGYQV